MPAKQRALPFRPPFWLRGPHLQSIFPSLSLRKPFVRRRCAALLNASCPVLLNCGEGVRLLGHFAAAPRAAAGAQSRDPRQRLVIILHGWEGSSDSMYVIGLGQYLLDRGFDVFRLNLRDHGESHHLNRDIFHSCRLAEVRGAVSRLAQLYPDHQRSMVGFSLGGNFALRIGASLELKANELMRIVAVSPVLDPQATLQALESGLPLYRRYFIDKWRRSLLKKQRAWPGQYDFAHLSQLRDLTRMTEDLVLQHTQYSTLAQYLQGYAITGEVLRSLQVASHILIAKDDPIIPAQDLSRLHPHPRLRLTVTEHGGHCGFRDRLFGDGWLDRFIFEDLVSAG